MSEQERYLTLLPGHQSVPTDPTQSKLYLLLKILNIEPDCKGKVWVLLIPGYTISTSLTGIFLQLITLSHIQILVNYLINLVILNNIF